MPKPTSPKPSHLVAMGGGGFSMDTPPESAPLDNYVLRLSGKKRPKICFIPTASGDSDTYIARFLAAFPKSRAHASVLHLFRRDATNPHELLLAQDIVYVGGGNTANLLEIWRRHGIDTTLGKLWKRGNIVLAGISAGMNCWFDACSTDSFGPLAPLTGGLGIVPGAACPHFDGEERRRSSLVKFIASGKLPPTHAADDFAAFHFTRQGSRAVLHDCIKSRPTAGCYFLEKQGRSNSPSSVVIESLPTRLLDLAGR